jgi:hypothetical protein
VSFDPYAPYGPLVESTIRVVTWNVWGRYGADCEARQAALEQVLAETAPDLVCLVETWRQGDSTQPGRVAARLGSAWSITNLLVTGGRRIGYQASVSFPAGQ